MIHSSFLHSIRLAVRREQHHRVKWHSTADLLLCQKDRPAIHAHTLLSSSTEQIVHEIGSENMTWNDLIFSPFLLGLQKPCWLFNYKVLTRQRCMMGDSATGWLSP